jgi:hypothetical protein
MATSLEMCQDSVLSLLICCGGLVANNKPKFSAGLVVTVITLFFVAVFGFAVVHGSNGFTNPQFVSQSK